MQVIETLSDGLKRAYTVVVPAADIEGRRQRRLAELTRTLRLPGFRPGKVPASLVKQRYGGAVTAEILEETVNSATQEVLTARSLRSVGQPKVEVVSIAEAADLEFKVEVELLPDISLPDFGAIALTRPRAEAQAEVIDRALGEIAKRQRTLDPVDPPRGAEAGEMLTIDFVGRVDGTPFPGGEGKDIEVEVNGPGFVPGFTEQLAGLAPGETREIAVTFPEGYGVPELAGKPATFEITAKRLRKPNVPLVDEELAKAIGFEDLAELRQTVAQQVQREYDQMSRLRVKRQLLDALASRVDFPVPESMVEAEFKQIWERVEADRKEGRLDEEDRGKDEAVLRDEYGAIAARRVRLGLLLAEIGRANGITVAADELTRAMRAEAARYPGQEQQVLEFFRKNPQAAETLRGPIFEEKVVDFVLELANVTDETVTPEELAQDPAATVPPGAPMPPGAAVPVAAALADAPDDAAEALALAEGDAAVAEGEARAEDTGHPAGSAG